MLNDSIKNFHRERNNKGANKAFIEVNDATYGKLTELREQLQPSWKEGGIHLTMSETIEFCIFLAFREPEER